MARTLDWAATPLGPVDTWPAALVQAVRLVLDAAIPMSLWCGPRFVLLYNDAYIPVLRAKHPMALGKEGAATFAELWGAIGPQFESVRSAGQPLSLEAVRFSLSRMEDGTAREGWFDYALSALRDPATADDEVIAVFTVVTETTSRVEDAHALAAERERLRSVVMNMPAPVALHAGAEHRYELVNDAYRRISGGGRDVRGLTVRAGFPELEGQGLFEAIDRVYVTGEPFVVHEMLIRYDRDGRGVRDTYFNVRLQPVRDGAGHVTSILNFSFDITDQVGARHEVEAVNRQLQETAVELEMQAEELQSTAAQLAERTEEAENARAMARRAELRMANLFQQAPAFIAVVSGPEYVYEFANDAYYQLIGHRRIIGRSVIDVLPEVREQGFIELLDRVRQSGEPYVGVEMPLELVPSPGAESEHRYVTFVYAPVADATGAITAVFVHGVDVTEQVRVRRELVENERQFRLLADAIPTLAWTARADGYIDWYNARWYEYTGTSPAQMEGWGWQSVHDADALPWVMRQWQEGLATREPVEMIFPLRGADGVMRQFLTRIVPVKDSSGAVVRWFGTNTDVDAEHTARTAAERAAARTRQLQELTAELAAVSSLEDVAFVVTTAGKRALGATSSVLLMAQRASREVVLVAAEGVRGGMTERYAAFSLDAAMPSAESIRTGEPVWVTSRTELEHRYPVLAEFFAVHDAQAIASVPLIVAGDAIGAMSFTFTSPRSFSSDESEFLLVIARQAAQAVERARLFAAEREARAAAESANRAKTEFLSTMSHELRTPLNAVAGYAELLAMGLRGPVTEAQLADLARIRRAGQHLQSLINDVLNLTRIESGRVDYDMSAVEVDGLLTSVEELVMPQLEARGLRYHRRPAERAAARAVILADEEKVRQILVNVLSNAVRYTPPSAGTISVAYVVVDDGGDATPGVVRISVTDTGRGIPADQLARIFEPFVQVERNLTEASQQGVGLGLAISRDLARGMAGDLSVESVLGKGSTFTLTIPRFVTK